ncbi:hypothetical protein SAMN04490244_108147 [Tranquillimonas rosea]|uniref:Acetolactate synthase n=1 Tax=Tranquillimonas rosea TaxID=641238 RepID=A0A1H9VX42_9RHOB|nr:DUF6497 family protein [Tranquillimonas rosea]SES25853.1 hypothetical protein SAMN04490244_108147 [Tranquillimonas rosea]
MRHAIPNRTAAILVAGLVCAGTPAAAQQDIHLPSGRDVSLIEMRTDSPGADRIYRFRFLAPGLEGPSDFDTAEDDMAYLCEHYAIPHLPEDGPAADRIVVSLSDREIPFGQSVPEAVQFFEAYRPEGGTCIWEGL